MEMKCCRATMKIVIVIVLYLLDLIFAIKFALSYASLIYPFSVLL